MARYLGAYENGVEKIIYNKTGVQPGSNRSALGETVSLINGVEVDNSIAWPQGGQGTKSNIYLKWGSLKSMESVFRHEFTHANDMFTGRTTAFFRANGAWRTKVWMEIRAYRANIQSGYRKAHYQSELNRYLNGWRTGTGNPFPF